MIVDETFWRMSYSHLSKRYYCSCRIHICREWYIPTNADNFPPLQARKVMQSHLFRDQRTSEMDMNHKMLEIANKENSGSLLLLLYILLFRHVENGIGNVIHVTCNKRSKRIQNHDVL